MYSRIYILNCNIFKDQFFLSAKANILKGAIECSQPKYKKKKYKEVKRKNLPPRGMLLTLWKVYQFVTSSKNGSPSIIFSRDLCLFV